MIDRLWQGFWSIAGAVSVRWKIMGIVIGVILVLGGAVTYQLARSSEQTLRQQVEEKGLAMSRGLAARGADLVLTNQRFSLYELAQEILHSDHDVEYVYVADTSGQPLVHTFGTGFPRDLLQLAPPGSGEEYRVTRLSTERGVVQDIAVPILGGRGGYAHVGMSESQVESYVLANIRTNLLIIAGVLLLGTAGAFGLATVLTRPVARLVEATEAVGRGEFDKPAPVWATDEIGQLGIAFNAMTDRLQESQDALLSRNRDLEALNAVASAANQSLDREAVMEAALEQVLRVSDARAGWILLLDEDTERLRPAVQRGVQDGDDSGVSPLDGMSCPCLRAAVRGGNVEVVRDGCAEITNRLPRRLADSGIICVPLRSKGKPLGVLNALHSPEAAPDDRQRRLLLAIGDQVGVALENAQLLAELREKEIVRGQLLEQAIAAQEEERKRIARELHDETGQALTSVAVMLKSLESAHLPGELQARVADIHAVAASAVRAVHDLALELRPSVLDDAGLAPAMERYVREFSERHGIPVDIQVTGFRERLPAPIETALYRIAQEALTNIARHARAKHASLLLERRDGAALLLIEDDGRGFTLHPHGAVSREHLGIHGMEERATLIGGRLTIETSEGAGTSVYVEVPLQDEAGGE